MDVIQAPFTPDQVAALNRWQQADAVHPMTCGERNDGRHRPDDRGQKGVLTASEDGMGCPTCGYRQLWVLDVMLTEPPDYDWWLDYVSEV